MFQIRHLAELLALCSAGLFTTTIAFAAAWIRARDRATRAESLLEGIRLTGRTDTSSALDAIAEEVERIGEGQRFITRIMSEHASRGELARPRVPGAITPH
jgi:hypothetical protein